MKEDDFDDSGDPDPVIPGPGQYAIIHYCPIDQFAYSDTDPIPNGLRMYEHKFSKEDRFYPNLMCPIVRWCAKTTSRWQENFVPTPNMKNPSHNQFLEAHVEIVAIEDIQSPMVAVKDPVATFPHQFMFLHPREEWSEIFRQTYLSKENRPQMNIIGEDLEASDTDEQNQQDEYDLCDSDSSDGSDSDDDG